MIRVLVADEHELFGAALEALLRVEPDLEVVARAVGHEELLARARAEHPDVAIIDSRLPGPDHADGITAAMAVREAIPATAVLLLTARATATELQRAAGGGIRGYVRKQSAPGQLLAAIRAVAAGQQTFDAALVADVLVGGGGAQMPTARELSTLRLVAAGLSNTEIAHALRLSPGTVRNYVSSVIMKTHARNRVDAIRIARDLAWL